MPQKRNVKRLVVGQLQTNCYLVFDERDNQTIIIDPGDDADYITRILTDLELKPTKIIATHGHYDHILGVTELKLAYNLPFLMNKKDEFLLSRQGTSALHFSGLRTGPAPKVDKYLKEGDFLRVGNYKLEIIHTPGHTPGSVSLYSNELEAVFVGDVIFAGGGVGRTDFKYASRQNLEKSIKKLLKLPKKTVVYSGHGEEAIIADLVQ